MVDAGAGDGTLSAELVAESVFQPDAGLVHLVEPTDILVQDCGTAAALMRDSGVACEVHAEEFFQFTDIKNVDIPGVLLAVHSSYYFCEKDIETLTALKSEGYGGIIIENSPDCWVAQVMQSIGNEMHPQFDPQRFDRIGELLSLKTENLSEFNSVVEIGEASIELANEMVPFFAFGLEYENDTMTKKLWTALDELGGNALFKYRIWSWPPKHRS
jgi:hypothetical protein